MQFMVCLSVSRVPPISNFSRIHLTTFVEIVDDTLLIANLTKWNILIYMLNFKLRGILEVIL